RHHAIACADKRIDFLPLENLIDYCNRVPRRLFAQPSQAIRTRVHVVDFNYEPNGWIGAKGPDECFDRSQRVLSLKNTEHVEQREKQKSIGWQAKVVAAHAHGDLEVDGVGNAYHGYRRYPSERFLVKRARSPDFLVLIKSPSPLLGKLLELPVPKTDVV